MKKKIDIYGHTLKYTGAFSHTHVKRQKGMFQNQETRFCKYCKEETVLVTKEWDNLNNNIACDAKLAATIYTDHTSPPVIDDLNIHIFSSIGHEST